MFGRKKPQTLSCSNESLVEAERHLLYNEIRTDIIDELQLKRNSFLEDTAMKKRMVIVLCLLLALVMAFMTTGCTRYAQYTLRPGELKEPKTGSGDVRQLSIDDIQKMNNGKAYIVYGDPDEDGNQYVTFINGKYYEEKVEDQEDAVKALQGIAALIGFGKGSEFFANFGERDPNGYTYWVLQQKYGPSTVQYATIRVVVDPEGYVCGLSSSVVPNLGIANSSEGVGADRAVEQAKAYMKETYPDQEYRLYEENTQDVVAEYAVDDCFYHAYAVYTSNPDVEEGATFDLPYLEHIITYEGEYMFCNPTTTMAPGETPDAYNNDVYFENLEPDVWEGDVTLYDGSKRHIKVPVAKSKVDGTYYLADVERKIIVADYVTFMTDFSLDFIESDTNSGWKDYMLMALYNYGRVYDFYKELGVYGADTFGTPMLILTDWEENGRSMNNACCYGNVKGWIAFGASNDYYFEESLDVLAHEFTHGITGTEMLGSLYVNESGAINESLSDIMGEICEHMVLKEDGTPESDDELWYHGQNKPEPGRCMSDPNLFQQPASVGDLYYIVPSSNADGNNDGGGNHFNSSLLNYVAWTLFDQGMPLEEERQLWYTTICLMTPRSDYDDVLGALLMSIEINGLDSKWADLVQATYEELGLVGDRLENAYAKTRANCGRIEIKVDVQDENSRVSVIYPYLYDEATEKNTAVDYWMVPDDNGRIYTLLPAGSYILELLVTDLDGRNPAYYYLQADGSWGTSTDSLGFIRIKDGETTTVTEIR